ncbi:MAG: PQQ-dependent dehydrogenase, methanol/ethanol family [Sphingobium sp.]
MALFPIKGRTPASPSLPHGRNSSKWAHLIALCSALALAACQQAGPNGDVDSARIARSAGDGQDWLVHGRTYDGQRYSPLEQITPANANGLGLAWYADLDTNRGQEATPLVIDGMIYVSTAWSKVKAYDGRSGALLWEYDPEVPGKAAVKACCDVVNRGLGAWGNKLFVGTLDGRLIALDRKTGKPLWSTTTVDPDKPYTITGAPIVIKGRVIIGNGGADMGAVRGYVTAYDADSGKQLWRFYTVPDNPANGPQPAYLERALKTWKGDFWKYGGGGTVWDSMAYDPDLDLLYLGVGNGSPWNQAYRSPGGGDNLYLSSVVAIRPETGDYVWHYQETPGETWDYTATQHIILADLMIDGKPRKVLMQAPKNGFFYVIDRETGKLISASNYVPVNWADGIDLKTGRPRFRKEARYDETGKPAIVTPSSGGAHNWQPMAYDAKSGLVFIPAQVTAGVYVPFKDWKPSSRGFNSGTDFAASAMPADPAIRARAVASVKGMLIAWDPVAQKERWRVAYPGPSNGGLLATAGGVVFQGTAGGQFNAFEATTGRKLWSMDAQTGILAAPISYAIDGEQYVAVMVGWGSIFGIAPPGNISTMSGAVPNISRLLVFRLGGKAMLPEKQAWSPAPIDPPAISGTEAQWKTGHDRFARYCAQCHGETAYGGTVLPDLRRSATLADPDIWTMVVRDGALEMNGMAAWKDILSDDEIEALRLYVIKRANEDRKSGQ